MSKKIKIFITTSVNLKSYKDVASMTGKVLEKYTNRGLEVN
jgi:hypothetical protein